MGNLSLIIPSNLRVFVIKFEPKGLREIRKIILDTGTTDYAIRYLCILKNSCQIRGIIKIQCVDKEIQITPTHIGKL